MPEQSRRPRPARVPGVEYGKSDQGPLADELDAVEKRRKARDYKINRTRIPELRINEDDGAIMRPVKNWLNKRTADSRARADRALQVSKEASEMGRRLVNERYAGTGYKKGGSVKSEKSFTRGDGCCAKGGTKGTIR